MISFSSFKIICRLPVAGLLIDVLGMAFADLGVLFLIVSFMTHGYLTLRSCTEGIANKLLGCPLITEIIGGDVKEFAEALLLGVLGLMYVVYGVFEFISGEVHDPAAHAMVIIFVFSWSLFIFVAGVFAFIDRKHINHVCNGFL